MNHVYNLRSKRCFSKILRSIHAARNRFGFRVVHYSVQGDHFHFMVEAANRKSLSRGMQGLTIRIVKALNKVMERKGKVFADRYHARILRTPSEVRAAVGYVLKNGLRHSRRYKKVFPQGWIDPFSSFLFFWETKTGRTLGAVFKTVRRRGVLRVVESGVQGTGPPRAGPRGEGLDIEKGFSGRGGVDESDAGCFYDGRGHAQGWIADFFYHRSGLYEREVVSPRTWLLSVGWRKAGDVDMTTVPGKL